MSKFRVIYHILVGGGIAYLCYLIVNASTSESKYGGSSFIEASIGINLALSFLQKFRDFVSSCAQFFFKSAINKFSLIKSSSPSAMETSIMVEAEKKCQRVISRFNQFTKKTWEYTTTLFTYSAIVGCLCLYCSFEGWHTIFLLAPLVAFTFLNLVVSFSLSSDLDREALNLGAVLKTVRVHQPNEESKQETPSDFARETIGAFTTPDNFIWPFKGNKKKGTNYKGSKLSGIEDVLYLKSVLKCSINKEEQHIIKLIKEQIRHLEQR